MGLSVRVNVNFTGFDQFNAILHHKSSRRASYRNNKMSSEALPTVSLKCKVSPHRVERNEQIMK